MTADQLILVSDGLVQDFSGDIAEYQKWLLEQRRTQIKRESEINSFQGGSAKDNQSSTKVRRKLQAKLDKLDGQLITLNKALDEVTQLLSDPESYEDSQQQLLQRRIIEQTQLRNQIKDIEAEWLVTLQELEALDS
jgi:ATP-binding cassette subfamily F protein 3